MKLATELYTKQVTSWPQTGKQILGQFDDDSFVVYQASLQHRDWTLRNYT